jgi:hypothetical protein
MLLIYKKNSPIIINYIQNKHKNVYEKDTNYSNSLINLIILFL